MSTFGIRDPRIAAGFQTLSNAMFPSAMDTVRASVLGAQREMINARAGLYGAQTADANMDMEGRRRMSDVIAGSGVDFSQQHNRQQMLAGAVLRSNTPQAVAGAAGAMGVVNPNMPDLSNILTAGGVQTFQNTPQGFAEANTRATQQADADRASRERVAAANNQSAERIAAMPSATGGGAENARRFVPGAETARGQEMAKATLARMVNERNGTNLSPEAVEMEPALQARVLSDFERNLQRDGRPFEAMAQALAGLPIEFTDNGNFLPIIGRATRATARLRAGGANPTPSGGGGTGAAGGAQAAPAAGPARRYQEGEIHVNRATGERVVFRNNQWAPIQ